MSFLSKHRLKLCVALLLIASFLPIWAARHYGLFLNDDAYITLAYAKNILHGNGFIYNYPPATLGTTTPLYALLIALFADLFPQFVIPQWAVFISSFCCAGIAWTIFIFRWSWDLVDWQAMIIGLILLASGWYTALEMEAYLFAFLLVLCFSLFFRRNFFLAGFISGLLFLTRGEGILVLFIMIGTHLISEWVMKRKFEVGVLWRALYLLAGFCIPVLLWVVYAENTFGSILPNTLYAKRAQGLAGRAPFLFQRITQVWLPHWGRNIFPQNKYPNLNVWLVLVVIGLISSIIRRRKWLVFLIWIILYVGGYTLLKAAAYWWYVLPVAFVFTIFLALGVIQSIDLLMKKNKSKPLGALLSCGLVIFVVFNASSAAVRGRVAYQGDRRGSSYINLSSWFEKNTSPSESIAFVEIGYLGFYTNNRIIDLEGLTRPDIIPHIGARDVSWGFWHYKPDYYIYLPDFDWVLSGINSNPEFEHDYAPVTRLPGPAEADIVIYKRIATEE